VSCQKTLRIAAHLHPVPLRCSRVTRFLREDAAHGAAKLLPKFCSGGPGRVTETVALQRATNAENLSAFFAPFYPCMGNNMVIGWFYPRLVWKPEWECRDWIW